MCLALKKKGRDGSFRKGVSYFYLLLPGLAMGDCLFFFFSFPITHRSTWVVIFSSSTLLYIYYSR